MLTSYERTDFTVQVISFRFQVLTPLGLGKSVGAAIRGALFESLRSNLNICLYPKLLSCHPCPLRAACPLSAILATTDDEGPWGHDVPRPLAISPALSSTPRFESGSTLNFEIALFGTAAQYTNYLVLAAKELDRSGIGCRLDVPRQAVVPRGAVKLQAVEAVNPFTEKRETIFDAGTNIIRRSSLQVTAADIGLRASALTGDKVMLDIRTPTRLTADGNPVKQLQFATLIERLCERLETLDRYYGSGKWTFDRTELLPKAAEIRVVKDATTWIDVESYSSRLQRKTPLGGLVGKITFGGDLSPFRSLLIWGSLVHVGKSATRGNGWCVPIAPTDSAT